MQLLRLAGPPGVGKSTIAWALASRSAAAGRPTGYVDIDQLGMLYPPPADDADRVALKERALRAVAREHRAAGVEQLVVSGVASPDDAPPAIAGITVRSLWCDAAPAVLRERLAVRGWDEEQVAEVVAAGTAESARLHPDWERLGIGELTITQAVERVLERIDQPEEAARSTADPRAENHSPLRPTTPPGHMPPILWLTGPRCAGASSVGWALAADAWSQRTRTAFLDLAQLAFATGATGQDTAPGRPLRHHALALRILVALRTVLRAAGARELLVVAPLEVDVTELLGAPETGVMTMVRLDADDATLRERVGARARGAPPLLASDDLRGAPASQIDAVADLAAKQRKCPLRAGEQQVTNAERTPTTTAAAIRRLGTAERRAHP
ncbi:AAA family ATPase [Brachybacterium sacelli]|uniref:Broad-specificity NMP kinase n=1 Tax=Brachybacterium sacelli TaxID=173364 RepID=A0ABS4X7A8_9MICO|nr:hypothetical protein [Brachybacterium sacelli]MBP2383604.1 broad-specificity NMP kinase [Brachybacterium sacelli]